LSGAVYLGFDPGINGAVAAFYPEDGSLLVRDMPTFKVKSGKTEKSHIDEAGLARIVQQLIVGHVPDAAIEKVGAMPGQGVTSMFNFGTSFGIIRGVVAALDIRREFVTPQEWKRETRTPAGKDGARARASEIFPIAAPHFARVKDDGRAEAALIAYWCFRKGGKA
jgi:crossover junction endodeoxyribonuclease RuvC